MRGWLFLPRFFRGPAWVTAVALVIALGPVVASLGAFAGSPTGVLTPANGSPQRPSLPVAIPPVHVHPLELVGAAPVDPTMYYSSEPAPMGIGDFGIGAGGNPYSYNTTEFLGNFSWQQLSFDGSAGTSFTDQLNVVLQFVQDGVTYAYWIQDVAFMDSATNELTYENNIWNFSSTSACLSSSAVEGNGTVYPYSGCVGYYATGTNGQPGSDLVMPNPGDFGLLVRSYETGAGLPAVAFEYWDGVTSWYVTYDNVVFPWAKGISADDGFVVDGYSYNPYGLFYDAELAIGGPGGGSSTVAYSETDITSRLLYWNGHNLEAPPSVWNFGSNTGESVSNIQSIFGHDAAGFPLTVQLNGTTRNATPAQAYNQDGVGEISISAPGVSKGTVAILGDSFPFVNDLANVTLVPGTYPIWVNGTSGSDDLGLCHITAGATVDVTVSSGCGLSVSQPAPSQGAADVGQSVTFTSILLDGGSGGDTYAWHTTPAGLGCVASTTLTLSCTPTAPGTYQVNLTVTDSDGNSSTSSNLDYVVSSDPTVPAPAPSQSSAETGATVSFTANPSGGESPYSYSWSGLPTPCTGTTSSEATCTPTTSGTYSITVAVTDANGFRVSSAALAYTVKEGPSVATPTATPAGSVDLGKSVTFSAVATGGSGGYTFVWKDLPAGCPYPSTGNVTCTPTGAGAAEIRVTVTDVGGGKAMSPELAFTVYVDPVVASVSASPGSVDVGQTVHFEAVGVTGGSGVYRYVWSGLPTGCATSNVSDLGCAPTGAGTGTVQVVVIDTNGGNDSATLVFTVLSDPTLSGVAAPSSADLGETMTFAAQGLTGGTGSYSYLWTGLPVGCVSRNASTLACTPTAVGSGTVTLTVTDSNGVSADSSRPFTIDPPPQVNAPTVSPGSVTVGESVTFSVVASGGSGSFTYRWSGLPPGCAPVNASTVACSPTATGSYLVNVTVTDSNGATALSGTLSLTVESAPTFLGLPTVEGYELLAGLAILAVLVVVLVVWAARRRA